MLKDPLVGAVSSFSDPRVHLLSALCQDTDSDQDTGLTTEKQESQKLT